MTGLWLGRAATSKGVAAREVSTAAAARVELAVWDIFSSCTVWTTPRYCFFDLDTRKIMVDSNSEIDFLSASIRM